MIFKLVFKEMIKNPINIIINIGLVTMFFVIIIGIISFSMQLPTSFKSTFFEENTKIRIRLPYSQSEKLEKSEEFEFEHQIIHEYSLNYYSDGYSGDYISYDVYVTFSNDLECVYYPSSSEYVYISYSFAYYNNLVDEGLVVMTDSMFEPVFFKVRILEKTKDELNGIYVDPSDNQMVYLSYESNNNLNGNSSTYLIIRDIDDFESYYQFLINENLINDNTKGIISIYRAYRTGEMLLYSLAFLCIFLSAFILYSMMDIIIMKKEKYIGLLKSFGYDNKKVFLLYFILIEMILIISLLISSIILELYYNYINQMIASSLSIFVNLQTNFLTILIAFSGFNLLFIIFFIRIFRKIKNNSILTFLKAR